MFSRFSFPKVVFALFALLVFTAAMSAQSGSVLRVRCPNTSIYSIVQITGVGDINIQPCAGKTTTFTQNVTIPGLATNSLDNGSAAAPSLKFTNSLTTGVYRAGADIFGITTAGVANTTLSAATDTMRSAIHIRDNAAATAEFKETLTPGAAGLGSYQVGDATGAGKTFFSVANSTGTINGQGIVVTLGDGSGTVGSLLYTLTDSTNTVKIDNAAHTVISDETGVNKYSIQKTNTAGGTTGNQTINKPGGTVNIAAAAASVVITNNTITTSSLPFVTLRTADATCTFVKSAVPTANTLTITLNAACGAETSVGWFVLN